MDRLLGLTEGPFQGERGQAFLHGYVFNKVGGRARRTVCARPTTTTLFQPPRHKHTSQNPQNNPTQPNQTPNTQQCLRDFVDGAAARYAPAGKALRLLEHHAPFFHRQLTARPLNSYRQIHAVYARAAQVKSAASTVDKHALHALEAVLAVLARHCEGLLPPTAAVAAAEGVCACLRRW